MRGTLCPHCGAPAIEVGRGERPAPSSTGDVLCQDAEGRVYGRHDATHPPKLGGFRRYFLDLDQLVRDH